MGTFSISKFALCESSGVHASSCVAFFVVSIANRCASLVLDEVEFQGARVYALVGEMIVLRLNFLSSCFDLASREAKMKRREISVKRANSFAADILDPDICIAKTAARVVVSDFGWFAWCADTVQRPRSRRNGLGQE